MQTDNKTQWSTKNFQSRVIFQPLKLPQKYLNKSGKK